MCLFFPLDMYGLVFILPPFCPPKKKKNVRFPLYIKPTSYLAAQ